jgi:Protein O-mannosyl-transferase TMEM260-like
MLVGIGVFAVISTADRQEVMAPKTRSILAFMAAFFVPFGLYVRTLAPTVYNLDSAELTTAAYTGGLIRATGYPLYLLLGRLWSHAVPLGDVGYRMNLLSAVFGALTIALGFVILKRLGVGPWAAAGALGMLMVARYFWAMSLVAEVYTLQTALVAGMVLTALAWTKDPRPWRMGAATLLLGLGLAHHLTTVLLIPGWLRLMVGTTPSHQLTNKRTLTLGVAGLVAGLSLYLYLPFLYSNAPAFNYAGAYDASGQFVARNLNTLDGLLWLASGRQFHGMVFNYTPSQILGQAIGFLVELWRGLLIGVGPALLGAWVLARRNRRVGLSLLMMLVAYAVFIIGYQAGDKQTMYTPVFLLLTIFVGVGYQTLLDWVRDVPDRPEARAGTWIMRVVMVGAVVLSAVVNWPMVDRSEDWSTRERGESILRTVESHALVAGYFHTVPVIQYLQLVEGKRPDVVTINRLLIRPPHLITVLKKQAGRRAVYVDELSRAMVGYQIVPVGPLIRLIPLTANDLDSEMSQLITLPQRTSDEPEEAP